MLQVKLYLLFLLTIPLFFSSGCQTNLSDSLAEQRTIAEFSFSTDPKDDKIDEDYNEEYAFPKDDIEIVTLEKIFDDDLYIVHIGSFKRLSNVEKINLKLSKKGFPVSYKPIITKNKRNLFAFQVRSIQTHKQAISIAQNIISSLQGEISKLYITKNQKFISWVNDQKPRRQKLQNRLPATNN